MVPNAWPSGHPKYILSYERKNIYVYIYRYDILEDPGRASSLYSLRWHDLEIHPCVFMVYRIICSPVNIVLVPIPGPTVIEDGFRHRSIYVSME